MRPYEDTITFESPLTGKEITMPIARFVNDPDTQTLGDDFNCLRPTRLNNGAVILAYYPETSKSGIVLAHWKNDEFVTWRTKWEVDHDNGIARWECYHGVYFRGREREYEAWQDYMRRADITRSDAHDEEG